MTTASLAGKRYLITGGASGIALALTRRVLGLGAAVGIVDRNAERLVELQREFETNHKVTTATADVSDFSSIAAAVEQTAQGLGGIDVVVACAGITGTTLVDDLNVDLTERLMRVNLVGAFNTVNAAIPWLKQSRAAHAAVISSLVGLRGLPFTAGYCAAKSGIAELMECLRPELQSTGIGLTVVYPGYVSTPLTQAGAVQPPLKPLSPEQAAEYIHRAIIARRGTCAFPPGLAAAVRVLRWLPPRMYDRLMKRAAERSPHLKY